MKTIASSAVMAVNYSCATREDVLSATIRIALEGMSLPVASGSARGTSAMTAANGPTSYALNARIPTVGLTLLTKSPS